MTISTGVSDPLESTYSCKAPAKSRIVFVQFVEHCLQDLSSSNKDPRHVAAPLRSTVSGDSNVVRVWS